jgi:hypothetical protein
MEIFSWEKILILTPSELMYLYRSRLVVDSNFGRFAGYTE